MPESRSPALPCRVLATFALCVQATLWPAAAGAADLVDVFREAKANDTVYASARAALVAGVERLPQGRALTLPSVTASASSTFQGNVVSYYNNGALTGVPVNRDLRSNIWTVTLTQPIYRWQNWIQYEQAAFQVAQSEAQFGQASQDLVVRVAQAYFDVLSAENSLAFIQAQKTAISEQLAQAKRNFEVGTATITDTNEAQSRFDLSVSQEIAAQNDLEIRKQTLRQIIGRVPERLAQLKSNFSLNPPEPNRMDDWVEAAQKQSYAVRLQEAAVEIAEREVRRNRAGHLPTLDMVASYGKTDNTGNVNNGLGAMITSSTLGLQLSFPLYAGGSVDSRVREALANFDRARSDLENSRRQAALAARQSFLRVTNGMAQVSALKQAVNSSETALASNKLGYEVGVRINIDVLNAQQQLYSTRRDLSLAQYNTIMNGLRLKAAAGSLSEEDLTAVNGLLAAE
jgi:outer membrane protein